MPEQVLQQDEKQPLLFNPMATFYTEFACTIGLLGISLAYFTLPTMRDVLWNCYWIPIIVSAAALGWRKSSAFTILGVTLILCVSFSNWQNGSAYEFIKLIASGCSLATTAAVIGLISAGKETRYSKAIVHQVSLALTDPLTGLANRRMHDIELQRRLAECARYLQNLSVLLIDIDNFKQINDRFGHAAGDIILTMVAKAIQGNVRASDLAVRYGGEEFTVLLCKTTSSGAKIVAERIRVEIASILTGAPDYFDPISVSIGVAELKVSDDAESLIDRADVAMYTAKSNGKNCVVFLDDEENDDCREAKSARAKC